MRCWPRRGMPRRYTLLDDDLPPLRGSPDIPRQFARHLASPGSLACHYDELFEDIALSRIMNRVVDAPKSRNDEMSDLLKFKTATFAAFGLHRNGVWGDETAAHKTEHFGLWFGAPAASSEARSGVMTDWIGARR